MAYLKTEIAGLISHLSEDNFNTLVKTFNKEYYQAKDVRIVNGPYDGGIDLEIYLEKKEIRKNIQITVQKTGLDKKIKGDLVKAQQNVANYDYQSSLEFYTTSALSSSTKREYKRIARVQYDIQLDFYDQNDLAELSDEFPSIKDTIYKIYELKGDDLLVIDKQTKVLFDLLAVGKDTGELKMHFIHSLIFCHLYENPSISEQQLIDAIKVQQLSKENVENIIRGQISRLRVKGLIRNSEKNGGIVLSDDKSREIGDIMHIVGSQEALLKDEMEKVLESYGLKGQCTQIVEYLYSSFQENYNTDFEELTTSHNQFSMSIRKIFSDLTKYLDQTINDETISTQLAKQLLAICSNNDFLNKISASILFTKLYHSDKLDAYINSKTQKIVLDTQVLLRLICLQYKTSEYGDLAYQSVKQLYETVKEYSNRVKLNTTRDYIEEVASHLLDALKLERFFSLSFFDKFTVSSRNIFFNYYQFLLQNNQYDKDLSIKDFIQDLLGLEPPQPSDKNFITTVSHQLEEIFSFLNINVIHHPLYDNYHAVKKEYEILLSELDKTRSYYARDNDVRTIMYLSDCRNHSDESGFVNEAFLITWDNVFYSFRKRILEKFKNLCYWYIYSPSKYADKLSLMNFKLNPTAINQNIVSIAESSFNHYSKTISFIDLMSSLFNKEDLSDIKLAQKLIALENIQKPSVEISETEITEETSPLVDVLFQLKYHYSNPENKYNTNDLVRIFENNKVVDTVYNIFIENMQNIVEKNAIRPDLFSKIDNVIVNTIQPK
ncbi:MAG: hypothetical protein JSS82_18500 [Bacteroidetes bacterium]|nr:hypothetical protein [Bacteroidota bacterium]